MKSTYVMAIAIVTVLSLWLVSGQIFDDRSSEDSASEDSLVSTKTPGVRTRKQVARPFQTSVIARGRTEAKRSVELRSETSGKVVRLPLEKGALVKEGDVVCELALQDREVNVQQAVAAVKHARLEFEGARKLSREGFQSETNIASAEANLISAKAALKRQQLNLAYRQILAPFAGVIEERPTDIGDYLQPGSICAEIIDLDPMLLISQVTETELGQLETGDPAVATLRNGQTVEGKVSYVSSAADPVTRTYKVEVEIENSDYRIPSGLSADVTLPREDVMAHFVSPALLSLTDEGALGIKVVEQTNRVKFYDVSIVSDTDSGIWLSGLPDTIDLITLGQELVFDGQIVEAVSEDTVRQNSGKSTEQQTGTTLKPESPESEAG